VKYFFFFLLFVTEIYAARIPPNWRIAVDYGAVQTNYKEFQDSILFENKDIDQRSSFARFEYQYFLSPPWLDFKLGLEYLGINNEEVTPETDEFDSYKAYGNIGIVIPFSDFFQTKLVFEYFYNDMIVKNDEFGFENLSGYQLYPEFEFLPFGTDQFIQISPYIKFPLWSNTNNRQETTIGLNLNVPINGQGARFPTYAYQTALTIKIFYMEQTLKFQEAGFIATDFETKAYGVTIGISL
jgi:hypothetical protein